MTATPRRPATPRARGEQQQRRAEQHRQPQRVLPERGRDRRTRATSTARYSSAADPRVRGAGREQRTPPTRDDEHRPERAWPRSGRRRPRGTAAPSAPPPTSTGSAEQRPRGRSAPVGASRAGGAASSRNAPATGLASTHASASTAGERAPGAAGALGAQPRGDGERDPERERHPPDDDVGEHAGGEQPRRGRRAPPARTRARARAARTARRRRPPASTPTHAGPADAASGANSSE